MPRNKQYATNMSVTNCNFSSVPPNGDVFKFQIEPNSDDGSLLLNSDTYTNIYDPDFFRIPGGGFLSTDPRLISAAHDGHRTVLDRPPIFGEIKLKDIYTDPLLENYGKRYRNYADINVGQIMYYFDDAIAGTYFNPIFANESIAMGRNYSDPMNGIKPSYERIPIKNKFKKGYTGGLSFINDTNESREDLISLQMREINRSKYSARWT